MRPLSRGVMAVLVSTLTSAVAVAQSRPATPPRPNRAGPPSAANRDSMPGGRRGMQSGPGMRGPASGVLRFREQLELTDEQVKKLEALSVAAPARANEADMLRARADLMDATKGDINIERARAAYDKMARVRTDAQLAQLKTRQDIRNVLTPAQRTKFDAVAARRGAKGMRGGRGPGRGQPGMRGGRGPGRGEPGMRGARGPGGGPPQGMGPGAMRGGQQRGMRAGPPQGPNGPPPMPRRGRGDVIDNGQ
ncbi:MAG: Spy/CpxP family protein refolding chaperone [Gemmatimonadaceae bacterium]|nr:Spy/CpxP family protein refolding chaperone [Gemmatimonadaceae bacterium]